MLDERKQSYILIVLTEIISLFILYVSMVLDKGLGNLDILVNTFKIISIIGFPSAFILTIYLMKSAECWYSENKEIATDKDMFYLYTIIIILIVLSAVLVYAGIDTIRSLKEFLGSFGHHRVEELKVV